MKCRKFYLYDFGSRIVPEEVQVGRRLVIGDVLVEIVEVEIDSHTAVVMVEMAIEADAIYLTDETIAKTATIDGRVIPPQLVIKEDFATSHAVVTAADILTFRTDTPIQLSSLIQKNEIIAESPEEVEQLAMLGTKSIFENTSFSIIMRSFDPSDISGDESVFELQKKETGLRLYAAAMAQYEPAGQFRELWRVFEAAFRKQDDALVTMLSKYQPAKELGFSKSELKKLLVLRHRSSHANSQAGIEGLRTVDIATREKFDRLKTLVEQVILTKKNWGSSDLDVERLA